MAGDRQRVRTLLDAAINAQLEASAAFDEEYPSTTPDPPGLIVRVKCGDDVQAALVQARRDGATLLLEVGEHQCNLKIENDPSARPVWITSDTEVIPAEGQRMTREYQSGLAMLRSANGLDPVINYKCGSTGVNLTAIGTLPQQYDRTVMTLGTDAMTTVEEQPYNIIHDRLLMLGDPERGQHRGIQAHVKGYQLLNSSLLDFHEQDRDSQALAAWNGGQDLMIRNCHLEAGAENILFGGGSTRVEALAPQRILIEDCLITKNPSWISGMEYPPQIKCLLEVKHARQLTIRRCVFEQNWPEAWSSGVAITIKCCDQSGHEPWTLTEDVVLEHCVIRRVGSLFSIVGKNDGGVETQLMRHLRIAHCLAYDIDCETWTGTGALAVISNMPTDLAFDHLTVLGNTWGICDITGAEMNGTGFTLTNSPIHQGGYGIKGDSGMDYPDWAVDLGYAPTVSGLAIRKDPARSPDFGPGNVHIEPSAFDASFNDNFTIKPGSAVAAVPTTDGQPIGVDLTTLPTPGRWRQRRRRTGHP
jgi:hypothetical protein